MKTIFKTLMVGLGSIIATPFLSSAQGWGTSGNSISSGDFLGTTNNQDLVIKTNSNPVFTFTTNGDLKWLADKKLMIGTDPYLHFTGSNNTFLGYHTGLNISSGFSNVFLGSRAGESNQDGYTNVMIGTISGLLNVSSANNVFVGYASGELHLTGNNNTFLGANAGQDDSIGYNNSFLGISSGTHNKTGTENTFMGAFAGDDNKTGTRNTFIGTSADGNGSGNLTNATAIGYNVSVTASNSMVFGNGSVTKWGFGVNAGSGKTIEIGTTSTPGNGAYLDDGGDWHNPSDINLKENIKTINGQQILSQIKSLPISSWNYKITPGVQHIGPMAQDFYRIFKVGRDEKSISTIDPAGVALAGVKELITVTEKLNQQLVDENNELRNQLATLQNQVNILMSMQGIQPSSTTTGSNDKPVLYQNIPNPFTENTTINYYLPSTCVNASINVYGKDGNLLSSYKLKEKGNGAITISGNSLQPGNYSFELVVDGKKQDIKQCILIK